jgi:hypothetical protein
MGVHPDKPIESYPVEQDHLVEELTNLAARLIILLSAGILFAAAFVIASLLAR